MKGILLGILPEAAIVDLTHQVPAHNVRAGALALETAMDAFPPGTLFLCVVDPGVGSTRLPIVVQASKNLFVAPDNGLLTPVLRRVDAVARAISHPLLRRDRVSATFHGRDLFAVAAGMLGRGFPFARAGQVVPTPILLHLPEPGISRGEIRGEIVAIDRFGNAASNIVWSHLQQWAAPGRTPEQPATGDGIETVLENASVRCLDIDFGPIQRHYAEVAPGEPIALINSAGRLEIAVNQGSATDRGIHIGDAVRVGAATVACAARRRPSPT